MAFQVGQGGRPRGAKDRPASIPKRALNRAVREVAARAQQGSAEDQRCLLAYVAAAPSGARPELAHG